MSARILAFDTSSNVTAVAVVDAARVLAEDAETAQERHAETLLPRIQSCLARANLTLDAIDLFAVGIGPGSFTGVRVGVATAKGLGLATGKPVRGVVSLAALAAGVHAYAPAGELLVAPLLDAYKGEVFAALYAVSAGRVREVLPAFNALPVDAAVRLSEVAAGQALHVLGTGYRRYAAELGPVLRAASPLPPELDQPSAVQIAREAERLMQSDGASDLARLAPLYVRGSDAQLPREPLRL